MANATSLKKIGLGSALLLVVANMIGSGIFTTTGFLVGDPETGPVLTESVILVAWLIGGLVALSGALCYGELASRLPHSGGEYYYLSRIYHPIMGFLSGWVSLIVGFSAPIAANALIFGQYLEVLSGGEGGASWLSKAFGMGLLILLTFVHSLEIQRGAVLQNIFTLLKVVLIVGLIIAGLLVGGKAVRSFNLLPQGEEIDLLSSGLFAVALVLVFFAYSGWNAAAYITGEIKNPQRNVPRALVLGTVLVTTLYLLLNYVYLKMAAPTELAGRAEFGDLIARRIFGEALGGGLSGLIAFALISSTSSMIMAGPRVTAAIGRDFPFFKALGRQNKRNAPVTALLVQLVVSFALVLYGDIFQILSYIGLTLSLFAFLTVLGLYVMRAKQGRPTTGYRVPGYPVTPAIFLALVAWLMVWSIQSNSAAPIASGITLGIGVVLYLISGGARLAGAPENSPDDENAS